MAKEIKNVLINYIHDRQFKRCALKYLSGRLIDIGCGTKPYKDLLAPYITEYKDIGQDYYEQRYQNRVVPTKQCRSIISISYISQLLAARGVKSGVYKARQGDIPKPALLCRDYPKSRH